MSVGLKDKFRRAAQSLLQSQCLLVCSGSGMTAESRIHCSPDFQNPNMLLEDQYMPLTNGLGDVGSQFGVPILRGTSGLWTHYPTIKRDRITFE